jgi:folate-binding protein YgfZ
LNCLYAPLEHEALLHITGPDTLKFLQGQTTCDTRKVNPGNAASGAFCTPQGRVICDFLLSELGPEHFALRMRRDIRDRSSAAFAKYIVFSKARLDASRDDWQCVAVWGIDAAQALREVFAQVPAARFGASSGDNFVLVQLDEAGREFECYLHSATASQLLSRLATLMSLGTEAGWRARQIADGIARIEAATVEEFVPQSLNYDLTGSISFNKGCYTGQEVVARLHYRGKAKRRTYLFELAGETPCVAGTALYSAGTGQNSGNVVNASCFEGVTRLLATATVEGLHNGLHLGASDGPLLTQSALPYPIESD